MRLRKSRSLKWILTRRLIGLQACLLLFFFTLLAGWVWIIDPELEDTNESIIRVLAKHVERKADGTLNVIETPEIAELARQYPDLWFIVRDGGNNLYQHGVFPTKLLTEPFPMSIEGATLKGGPSAHAAVGNRDTPIGRLQFIASTDRIGGKSQDVNIWISLDIDIPESGGNAEIFWLSVVPATGAILAILVVPILLVTGAATAIVTPYSIGRSLTGLVDTANQAKAIEFETRSAHLDVSKFPSEIIPLVDAFNHTLSKLDHGYQQHSRFLADAAHELRTPIAIVRTRADLLPESADSRQLRQDIDRLSRVAHQLLDMQAIGAGSQTAQMIDLNQLVGRIAADLAPQVIDAGYDFFFEPAPAEALFMIYPSTVELAVSNLIRNAVDHSGYKGTIAITVDARGFIDVSDEGPGIPPAERVRVLEPFYRLNTHSSGAGLGLNLAHKAAELHFGRLLFADTDDGFRVRLEIGALGTGR
ncbi:signal transduction histidine kinase [Rhizobium pisi]|uniref:histidine kinase n=1 Tax=Rhizobium pisi TaxID=574561 RepID=A0A3R9B9L3_9HYPH|nr:HAMP domain-containing sensor histidine kinase [Rhizobium pisi]MBB3136312.1 signal transduction histidine kinase [Rhizobium pisi]RSB72046.1 sensor histidine kinase [Rhizobium pisi]TCA51482.1 HAMP domain-containing histidine kinase [Rhizobium pisi]